MTSHTEKGSHTCRLDSADTAVGVLIAVGKAGCQLGVLNGDGAEPETVPSAVASAEFPLGASAIQSYASAVPDKTLADLPLINGWLWGPHDSVSYPSQHKSVRVALAIAEAG